MAETAAADVIHWDGVLVLGAGLAGLSAALAAADLGRRVLVLAPGPLGELCASAWAQGGMAAALSPDDDPWLHAADTVSAGAGLVDPERAALMALEAPAAVRRLCGLGVAFDRDADGRFLQSLEAAHSRARVARVGGDGAGRAIMTAVAEAARRRPLIELLEPSEAVGLLQDGEGRVRGVRARRGGARLDVFAPAVVAATGGVGGLYAVTTNPRGARGAGLAIAAEAGAVIADPEFVQFHPTAIDIGQDPAPLATEALRGEGALLVDAHGQPFMKGCDPRGDLAPRDVVARAIHRQRALGLGAFLDARTAVGAHFPTAFPAVFASCLAAGLDPRLRPIPVAPAAHYHMGGVRTDECGAASLEGLFAAGECASTGVHGANRLASNSLVEAAVFGRRAGEAAAGMAAARPSRAAPGPDGGLGRLGDRSLARLRPAMSREAGVARSGPGLQRLLEAIEAIERSEGRSLETVAARLIAAAALERQESRGAHFREDHPALAAAAQTTLAGGPGRSRRGAGATPAAERAS